MTSTSQVIAEGLIADAYLAIAEPGELASIRRVREILAGRVESLDEILTGMYRDRVINLVPQSLRQALTAADKAAAVRCGGEDKHLMIWV